MSAGKPPNYPWLKRDLRTVDHYPTAEAAACARRFSNCGTGTHWPHGNVQSATVGFRHAADAIADRHGRCRRGMPMAGQTFPGEPKARQRKDQIEIDA